MVTVFSSGFGFLSSSVGSFLAASGRANYAVHSITIVANLRPGMHCQVSSILDSIFVVLCLFPF